MSYFDLKPAAQAVDADAEAEAAFGKGSLLTPQVTNILDSLGAEHSSSSSEDLSLSDDSDPTEKKSYRHRDRSRSNSSSKKKSKDSLRKSQSSPTPLPKRLAPPRPRHPHMQRFHSLRSMLFANSIEMAHAKRREEEARAATEEKWLNEHEARRGLNRPKTPESPKGSPTKEGFAARMSNRLRKLTSKDDNLPTIKDLPDDVESTASSDNDADLDEMRKIGEDSETESLGQKDVDELVRWVSRRDPPSDGERRGRSGRGRSMPEQKDGHESLGHSDVDELVKFASRKQQKPDAEEAVHDNWSDASTESDSEEDNRGRKQTFNDQDVDDLMRWVSRKDGSRAGPIREKDSEDGPSQSALSASSDGSEIPDDADFHEHPELSRWLTKRDDTSGESDIESVRAGTRREGRETQADKGSLGHGDVDELVRWVSRKDNRRSHPLAETSKPPPSLDHDVSRHDQFEDRGGSDQHHQRSLAPEDVDELVRFASQKAEPKQSVAEDDNTLEWKREQDDLGRSRQEKGSLDHTDVDDLLQFVRRKDSPQEAAIASAVPSQTTQSEAVKEGSEAQQQVPKDDIGRSQNEPKGSLQPDDVDELVRWVSTRDSGQNEQKREDDIAKWKKEEDQIAAEKAGDDGVGRSREEKGSLAPDDVDELLKWVSRK
ncbi:hypothetical protein EJ04DRAFT_516093 [Polyplosphaeria fusca]|uniref:Uncharacterized protein n=1 Tax=Polyplosphaeria fusca TaxID=682080 RepID=A0A9P4UUS9_9PLEO|nr:hypothetical protein EJ04DRAFT_516093 [Polyplosphaeria fusca]